MHIFGWQFYATDFHQVGKQIFTLPICLRKSTDSGYPPGDKPVVKFFSALPDKNDMSVRPTTVSVGPGCPRSHPHVTVTDETGTGYGPKATIPGQVWVRRLQPVLPVV